jgi:hypothetical protein
MKKVKTKLSIIVVLVFVFTMVIGATAFGAWTSVQKVDAYSGVKVYFNGQEVINPDQPLIINDRTYVPLRMIMDIGRQRGYLGCGELPGHAYRSWFQGISGQG